MVNSRACFLHSKLSFGAGGAGTTFKLLGSEFARDDTQKGKTDIGAKQNEDLDFFLSLPESSVHTRSTMKPPSNAACWWSLWWKRSFDLRGLCRPIYIEMWVQYEKEKKAPLLFRGARWEQLQLSEPDGKQVWPPPPAPFCIRTSRTQSSDLTGCHISSSKSNICTRFWSSITHHQHVYLGYLTCKCWINSSSSGWSFKLWLCGPGQDRCSSACLSDVVSLQHRPPWSHYVVNKTNKGFFSLFTIIPVVKGWSLQVLSHFLWHLQRAAKMTVQALVIVGIFKSMNRDR